MKKVIAITALVMTVLGAGAQKNVIKAFDDIMRDKSVRIVSNSNYAHPDVENPSTYCYFTSLRLGKKQACKINKIQEAFEKDALTGYKYVHQVPDAESMVNVVGYGPHLEYSVKFGTKNHNYLLLFVHDKVNTLCRYVYACVWYEVGNEICCMLYRIYGSDPAKASPPKLLDKLSGWPGSPTTTTFVDGEEIRVITSSGGKAVKKFAGGVNIDADINEIKTDTDFMMMFGNLRVAFLDAITDAGQKALQTGLVVKIVTLCKNHGGLLTDNERKTCKASLVDMMRSLQKSNPDTFLNGMLVEACGALGS